MLMPVLAKMNELSGLKDDTNVLLDKLFYMNNKQQGRKVQGDDNYPVPADLDWGEVETIYQDLVEV